PPCLRQPYPAGSFTFAINRQECAMSGLFDFVKTIGKKIFGESDPDPGAKIKAEIEKDNPGLKDLAVKFENGIVELTGSGPAEALQKAILMAGNMMGVGEVKVAGAAATSVEDGTQYYVIKSGDTLSAIAKQFYGDANKYPKIFEANREVIKDANLIFPGQKIRIPKA
ncbi:MAG: peptidoglycan-binding protein LysM, partial [Bradyrhizobium sp.]